MIAYQPSGLYRPGEATISPWSFQSLGVSLFTASVVPSAAAAWPAANLVIYIPFGVPEPITITKMFIGIGVAAGNIDVGIYQPDGTRVVSIGSTLAAGAASTQAFDITDTTLQRGLYYLAAVADTVTTLTIQRGAPSATVAQAYGLLEQASVTLPLSTNADPATFAKYTRAYIPVVGVQGYRTVGP